ncbi:MAG: amidohydrolase family protein [Chloroflexi bacterium]|nr:amidohydrolase family protein [Chloroflexota bacterium]
MSVDTIIRGGTVVVPDLEPRQLDVLIKGGTIVGLLADSAGLEAAEVIDATGLVVIPGGIEPHVHLGIYQPSDGEWFTETCAAASGGVTTLINYFFHKDSYFESLPPELEIARRQAIIDYAMHLGIMTEQHIDEMDAYVRDFEVTSFKFTGHWKGYEKQRIGSDTRLDDGLLYQTLEKAGKYPNVRIPVHSQNVEISIPPFAQPHEPHYLKRRTPENVVGLDLWERLNPGFTETEYIFKALYLAELTGASVYLVHLSSAETVRILRERLDLTKYNSFGETCAHYLGLTVDSPCGVLAKVNPPVRREEDQNALWGALIEGTLSTVGTDHCAARRAIKNADDPDVLKVKLGFPGMATMLPVLVTHGVKKRGMSLTRLAEVFSTNSAKIFGLYPKKGTIAVGSDADLAIIDLENPKVASASWIPGASDYSVFEGESMYGWPARTLVRGRTVWQDGQIKVEGGHGQWLPRRA